MEEDMIMNVPSAPEMQGTPMTPDLSMDMQSEMGDMTQNEIQEAQGALMQILQVINMLIEQGLNPEQIKAFLEQYGISEDELDQAAQALGVDIDMVLSGQMQAPQEPMMMAEGGPSEAALIPRQAIDAANNAIGFKLFQNDDGSLETYNPEQLENIIKVFITEYERQLGEGNQTAASVLSNQINNLDKLKIQLQSQMPMGLGEKKN
jgi:DNA-binding transcriptional MerR regulator